MIDREPLKTTQTRAANLKSGFRQPQDSLRPLQPCPSPWKKGRVGVQELGTWGIPA
jgi:hypothetical protein